jgi:nicotinate dehydrogenase subunit B
VALLPQDQNTGAGLVTADHDVASVEIHFSESQKLSTDWANYPILRFDEVPDIEVELMRRDDMPALGVGESAQGPTAAAIANAVFHASGNRLHRLPLN